MPVTYYLKIHLGGNFMPRFDGTGPMGQGTMTGRGLGTCTGNSKSANELDFGCRNGRGFKNGNRFCRRNISNNNFNNPLLSEIKELKGKIESLEAKVK
jgi:hypothetical protein